MTNIPKRSNLNLVIGKLEFIWSLEFGDWNLRRLCPLKTLWAMKSPYDCFSEPLLRAR